MKKKKGKLITFGTETHTITEWSRILGVKRTTLKYKIDHMGVERAFSSPVRKYEYSEEIRQKMEDRADCGYPDCFHCVYDDCISNAIHPGESIANAEAAGLYKRKGK